jgi:hypothetical protein
MMLETTGKNAYKNKQEKSSIDLFYSGATVL